MSQSVLVRNIRTLSGHHRTRKAIFEFDKLIRSIYKRRYLRNPQLQRDVHRSEYRIESYRGVYSEVIFFPNMRLNFPNMTSSRKMCAG